MIVMKNGQALVAVLMALAVLVTVGLSVASRSVTEVGITTSQEESAKALEAAEAGLEKAVGGTITGGKETMSGGSVFVVTPVPDPMPFKEYIIPYNIEEGETASVDMKGYTKDLTDQRKITFCWGKKSSNPVIALEVVMYYQKFDSQVRLGRRIYNPNPGVGTFPVNSYCSYTSNSELNGCPANFRFACKAHYSDLMQPPLDGNDKPLFFRMRLYGTMPNEAEQVAISTQGRFVSQGSEFVSVGSAGSATQKIRGINMNYDVPSIFDAALFSGTGLEK